MCHETSRARLSCRRAEEGFEENTRLPMERYARPGVDAVARHVAERDPAARRKR
ncbi:hypothetical protein ACFCYH_31925 [Streptomyces sp. NPDC056400]|uniref:hypothetical protein n=1 Tax=Streptomyces sp. NPDC056400 TaxID=3345808 RepID=UPI0035E34D4E